MDTQTNADGNRSREMLQQTYSGREIEKYRRAYMSSNNRSKSKNRKETKEEETEET